VSGISNDVLVPAIDRVVLAMSTKTSKAQREQAQSAAPELKTVDVDEAYLQQHGGGSPDDAKRTLLEYKRVGLLLCKARNGHRDLYDRLMTALHAPPPVYVDSAAA
jgi:hypothetical protein